MGTHRRINLVLFGVFLVLVLVVTIVVILGGSERSDGYLPKDVPYTPAASPLSSPPPVAPLHSDAVRVNAPSGNLVGPDTEISGTAAAAGTVYYRVSDFRAGQIAAGEANADGNPPVFTFKPSFNRPYTKGDPATLDVYTLDASGAEQTTRLNITLQ